MTHKTYKIYTIEDGIVSEGAEIGALTLKSGDKIPVIIVGEAGRGRKFGVLPVGGLQESALMDALKNGNYKGLNEEQKTIRFGSIGATKTGNPKLFVAENASETDKVIVVFRTPIGFRGGNTHTGDKVCEEFKEDEWGMPKLQPVYADFPGEILVEGVIAEGDAGRMGSGKQIIALVPKNKVFRIGYSGRRYGAPGAHYGVWDGQRLMVLTKEEREASDLF
ncbi:MAG: hypothetical protein LBH45_07195 [Campylobacteraceae bacterium]|jgi:hypothetical protein|nr:hypothetical protein [Campylobacteraceae bacterium]